MGDHGITGSLRLHKEGHAFFRKEERFWWLTVQSFDQTAFSVAGKLRDVDVVITDRKPSERWLARFTDEGIECRYPEV